MGSQEEPTACELNCRIVTVREAGSSSARELLYPAVEVDEKQVASALREAWPVAHISGNGRLRHSPAAHAAPSILPGPLRACGQFLQQRLGVISPWAGEPPPMRPVSGVAWAARSQQLAVAHAATGAVLVYDVAPAAPRNGHPAPPPLREARWVLTHALQQQAAAIAWRPQYSTMLAVGVKGCVLLWALGRAPGGGPDAARAPGGVARASVLHFREGARVSALAWSPNGRLLAGCSSDSNRIMVWDAALCTGASLRTCLAPHALLAWSPCGGYLLAANTQGGFTLWETSRWAQRSWDAPPGGGVTAVAWAPDGRAALLALGGAGGGLVALHLVGQPPGLDEQMLPVQLPELAGWDSSGAGCGGLGAAIADMSWDPTGQRLAVALQAPHPAAGCVALFATATDPVVTARLLGVVRPPWAVGGSEGDGEEDQEAGGGPRRGADLRVAFAAHCGDGGGGRLSALLSVQRAGSGVVALVPLYF